MSKKEKEIFLKKVFFLLEEKKNFENFIFFSNFSDIFYEILKKLFKKSSKEINYKPNFMEFDGNDYSNFKEICRKIKLFLDNFCISEKSFFPFRFIFFKNFDFLSKENHTSLKNMIDTSGNYLRFFFFCGKKKNIDLCLISRSVSFFFFSNKF